MVVWVYMLVEALRYDFGDLGVGRRRNKRVDCECMCMKVLMMPRCKQHKITSSQNLRSRKQDQEKYKT